MDHEAGHIATEIAKLVSSFQKYSLTLVIISFTQKAVALKILLSKVELPFLDHFLQNFQ